MKRYLCWMFLFSIGCGPQLDFFEKPSAEEIDNEGPEVVSVFPEDESEMVVLDSALQITFSEPIDPLSVSHRSIQISSPSGGVEGEITLNETQTEISFSPYFHWSPETLYTIEIDPLIQDLAGNRMVDPDPNDDLDSTPLLFSFTTGASFSNDPLEILEVVPPPDASGVDPTVNVSVQFSKPLDPDSLELHPVGWRDSEGPVRFALWLSRSSSLLTLSPLEPLESGREYLVGIPTGIFDRYGQSMGVAGAPAAEQVEIHFSTAEPQEEILEEGDSEEDVESEASEGGGEPMEGDSTEDSEKGEEGETEDTGGTFELAGHVVINEVVVDPQQDWGESSGGDGIPFNEIPGSGSITGSDEWIELFNATTEAVDLTGWSIHMLDGTDEVDLLGEGSGTELWSDPTSSIERFQPQTFLVVGNPVGDNKNEVVIELRNELGELVDRVRIGVEGGLEQDGNATGLEDEAIARHTDGIDTDDESSDFVRQAATPALPNR